MPIHPPALDDRGFDDLVDELVSRIPAHTPEWTNPREGDPGRTLIELFAWLTDTLLYRANLIPEKQRLAFLRLLGEQMRPATPARGVVSLAFDKDDFISAVTVRPLATLTGPVVFETKGEVTVLPVAAEAYCKSAVMPQSAADQARLGDLLRGLTNIYDLPGRRPVPYETIPVFAGGNAEPDGIDVVNHTVDQSLWLALLAPSAKHVEAARATLGARVEGRPLLISIGVSPTVTVPPLAVDLGPRPAIPHVWEITMIDRGGRLEYHALDRIADSTDGLTQRGVLRLALPGSSSDRSIGAPDNDVRRDPRAGVGRRPPRLDVPEKAERLVAWVRLRPTVRLASLSVSWVGVNAVEIDQRQTITGRVIGQSDGSADQEFSLAARGVERESLEVQVDETGYGYRTWSRIDDLALADRDDAVYSLDGEAGTIRFGDGVRGRVPEAGRRVRVATLRAGGGKAGNLPPGTLKEISAFDLRGTRVPLKVQQKLPTLGGDEAESLLDAERRIPTVLRHRDRAVSEDDYRALAAQTPGIRVGRVDVLSRFKPQQRRPDVPGVVTVLVLPHKDGTSAPAPRADRPFLEAVHRFLDPRRPLTTELYVIGCEYVSVGVGVGVTVRDGFAYDAAATAVRDALRTALWPLTPGGSDGTGWPLGRTVSDRELEVAVARVPDVSAVAGLKLFERSDNGWTPVMLRERNGATVLPLRLWQLPELLTVVVAVDGTVPDDLRAAPNPFIGAALLPGSLPALPGSLPALPGSNGRPTSDEDELPDGEGGPLDVAVPVVPEVC